MNVGQCAQKVFTKVKVYLKERRHREIAAKRYDLHLRGYKRIYLVHLRKTGGTSLNHMLLSLSGKDPASLYSQLAEIPDHRLLINEIVYVGWNVRYINKGNYFYGFSHTPLHKLDLPKGTFTVSCFRDPVKRVISHYNMLMHFRVNNIDHPCMATEGKWIGETFDDFLKRIPQDHLLNQLYMFSGTYDINEAIMRVKHLSHYFFLENFGEGVAEFNKKTGLSLEPIHIRKASYKAQISERSLSRLRDMLDREYKFLDYIKVLMPTIHLIFALSWS